MDYKGPVSGTQESHRREKLGQILSVDKKVLKGWMVRYRDTGMEESLGTGSGEGEDEGWEVTVERNLQGNYTRKTCKKNGEKETERKDRRNFLYFLVRKPLRLGTFQGETICHFPSTGTLFFRL